MEILIGIIVGLSVMVVAFVVLLVPGRSGYTLASYVEDWLDRISEYLPW